VGEKRGVVASEEEEEDIVVFGDVMEGLGFEDWGVGGYWSMRSLLLLLSERELQRGR